MPKGILTFASVTILLSGCTLPGLHFRPASMPNEAPDSVQPAYKLEAVTPQVIGQLAASETVADTPSVSASLQEAQRAYTYHVGPHDVLNIIVWNHPELTISQAQAVPILSQNPGFLFSPPSSQGTGFTVSSAGSIYFPYAGTLRVAGETVDDIRTQLAQALVSYTQDAQVDVQVVGFHSQSYQIAGAVVRPGLYSLTNSPLTVSQALATAGGELRSVPTTGSGNVNDLTSFSLSDLAHVVLISNGKREVLDLQRFYMYGDQTQDRLVHANDIIQVPNTADDEVHVIGEVLKQGNYPLSSGVLNLAQALGEAGGLNLATSDPARIFIFRHSSDGRMVYWLDARAADAMLLATQFALQPQDVVYVASTRLASWSRVVAQIVPTVQALYETKILVLRK